MKEENNQAIPDDIAPSGTVKPYLILYCNRADSHVTELLSSKYDVVVSTLFDGMIMIELYDK